IDPRALVADEVMTVLGSHVRGFDLGVGKILRGPRRTLVMTKEPDSIERTETMGSVGGGRSRTLRFYASTSPNRGGLSGSPAFADAKVVALLSAGGGAIACLVGMHRLVDALSPQQPELFRRILQHQALSQFTPRFVPAAPLGVQPIARLESPQDLADADNLGSLVFPGEITPANKTGCFTREGHDSLGVRALDGELVAFVSYRGIDDHTLELGFITSHPRYRGQGLEDALLEALEARARAEGKSRVAVKVEVDDSRTVGFYTTRGYAFDPGNPQHYRRFMSRSV
ncbi:MAG: GNAT family N-acetyltransferase, partial [Myxococcota bacterium]